jgi:hypothetical protein
MAKSIWRGSKMSNMKVREEKQGECTKRRAVWREKRATSKKNARFERDNETGSRDVALGQWEGASRNKEEIERKKRHDRA